MKKITLQAASITIATFLSLTGVALAQNNGTTSTGTTGTTYSTTSTTSITGTTPAGGVSAGAGGMTANSLAELALITLVLGTSGIIIARRLKDMQQNG